MQLPAGPLSASKWFREILSYCSFITILSTNYFEDASWLWVVEDLIPIFETTILNASNSLHVFAIILVTLQSLTTVSLVWQTR